MGEFGRGEFESDAVERVPSREEIDSILRELGLGKYTEVRSREDEKGFYLLEVTVLGEKPGEVTEYAFRRKGNYSEFKTAGTDIQVTYYEDEIPVGGTTVASWVDGSWQKHE